MDEADTRAANQAQLKHFIDREGESLRRTLRVYVARSGLASANAVIQAAADELLNETVVEALAHAERFDPAGVPVAWLLGIAANLIRRKQTDLAKRNRREPLLRDLDTRADQSASDDEFFDRFAGLATDDPQAVLEMDASVAALLDTLSTEDQRIVELAVLHELDGEAIARELGIKPGAARVRLHRAIRRLRDAFIRDGREL